MKGIFKLKMFSKENIFYVPSGGDAVIEEKERISRYFLVPCTGRREADTKKEMLL